MDNHFNGNNRRTDSRRIIHYKFIFITSIAFVIIGSILISIFHGDLGEKWELSPKMLLSFAIITAVLSVGAVVGAVRLSFFLVFGFSVYLSILSVTVLVLTINRLILLPVLAIIALANVSAFIYSNALRKLVVQQKDLKERRMAINLVANAVR